MLSLLPFLTFSPTTPASTHSAILFQINWHSTPTRPSLEDRVPRSLLPLHSCLHFGMYDIPTALAGCGWCRPFGIRCSLQVGRCPPRPTGARVPWLPPRRTDGREHWSSQPSSVLHHHVENVLQPARGSPDLLESVRAGLYSTPWWFQLYFPDVHAARLYRACLVLCTVVALPTGTYCSGDAARGLSIVAAGLQCARAN